ncbi:MAG: NAD+ synthase [Actinobacteria bacterium]|nr:NAD+ synthase [Actinomycetota bacterium]
MDRFLRLYCAQINSTVGDFKGNFEKIAYHIEEAKKNSADIIAFPELAITGYPPEDLLLKPAFISQNLKYLDKLKKLCSNITVIVGFVNRDFEIFNSAAIMNNEKILSVYNKQYLPNYSVFDEERYFQRGALGYIYDINGTLVGVNICEDMYYSSGPLQHQAISGGATLIINISASPYHQGKIEEREKILYTRAVDNRVNILYVNLVGGQDELVFDGNSMLVNEKGDILFRAKAFQEDFFIYDLDSEDLDSTRLQDAKYRTQRDWTRQAEGSIGVLKIVNEKNSNNIGKSITFKKTEDRYRDSIKGIEEEVFNALVLGTRDYVQKNGFKKAVLGLSGGIDSALAAVIAGFAIGFENVTGVLMPSAFSSRGSIDDSQKLAANTGLRTFIIPVTNIYEAYLDALKDSFKTRDMNITKENLQARIRGNILMALSNEHGWLLLATGNKSEISVGYCTLYGDMAGGFAPIKDVYKTMVYRVCDFINKKYGNIIPAEIIEKPPSAELKPDQTDQDTLPSYDILDNILKAYIEEDRDYQDIVKSGFDDKTVAKVINMVDFSEYKRRQGAPGIKITARAFGRDRRYPITNKYRLK